jgi:LmbE family N-acetylglucosaminyl deacetylase
MNPEQFIPQSVLVIMAHADDIEFGVSGSVSAWIAAGAEVTYCVITDGSSGSNNPETNLAELVEIRREEQLKAAAVVGVQDVRFLGYQDGSLEPSIDLRRDLTRLIREVRPERVVTFDPTTIFTRDGSYINHPDHRAAGEAAIYAVFPSAESRPIFPELLAEGLEPHKVCDLYLVLSNDANTWVDISDHIAQKQDALRCHASQLDEKVVQMVAGWNAELGKQYDVDYAEMFRVMNFRPEEEQAQIAE